MPQGIDHIGRLITATARYRPDAVALKDRQGRSRTYDQLDSRSNRLANGLLGLGLEQGDRIATWLSDSLEYLELYCAAAKAGLVLVPINARYTGSEASYLLDDSAANVLVFDDATAERVATAFEGDDFRHLIAIGDDRPNSSRGFDHLLEDGRDALPDPPDENDLLLIGYTSGTTGFPKGAMLTHRSIKNIARMNAISYRQPRYSVCAYSGSMSFVATIAGWVATNLWLGGTIVLMGTWEVDELAATVGREQATFTYAPSPLLDDIAELVEEDPRPWSTIRCVLHSASKVKSEDLERLSEALDGRVVEGLGMTENSGGLVTATTRGDMLGQSEASDVFRSVGRPAVDCELRLLSTDGNELPWDGSSVGELLFRSPAIMDGYWNNEVATASSIVDGWYHSGDMGYVDPAGFVYMVERRSDLIVSGGMNIYPSEVERIISQLPQVAEVKVVGAPHERWGQTVVACVVPREGQQISREEIVAHCRESLASYKKPTHVLFLDEFPRTASQKIRTGKLREMVRQELA